MNFLRAIFMISIALSPVFAAGCGKGKAKAGSSPKGPDPAPATADACADPDPTPDTLGLLQQVNDFAGLTVVDPYEGAYLAFEGVDDKGNACSVLWHSGSHPLCAGGECPPSLDSQVAIGASDTVIDSGAAAAISYSPGTYGEGFAGAWPFTPVAEHWELANANDELTLATRDRCQTRTVRATRQGGELTSLQWQRTQSGKPPEVYDCHALIRREVCPGTAPAAPTPTTVTQVASALGLDADTATTLNGTTQDGIACQVQLGAFTYSDDQGTRVTLDTGDDTSVSESYETRPSPGNHVGDDYVRNLTLTTSSGKANIDLTTPEGYVQAGTFPRCSRSHLEATVADGAVTAVKLAETTEYAWEATPFKATSLECQGLKP